MGLILGLLVEIGQDCIPENQGGGEDIFTKFFFDVSKVTLVFLQEVEYITPPSLPHKKITCYFSLVWTINFINFC